MPLSALTIGRKDLRGRALPRGLDLDRGCRTLLAAGRFLLAATICLAFASASTSAAQWTEMKVQKPWAYTYRGDEANNVEFMATTPATEDTHVWLLFVCSGADTVTVSLIHSEQFPYPLGERGHLILQLDNSEPVSVPVAVIRQKQITADPRATKDVMPVLMHSSRLSASIAEMDGPVHTYSFSLQPSDLALRDIDVHCVRSGP